MKFLNIAMAVVVALLIIGGAYSIGRAIFWIVVGLIVALVWHFGKEFVERLYAPPKKKHDCSKKFVRRRKSSD